ncbi:unnamed protein product [Danaus chrysippus]|uniref:(African queen) hypothetical protein n=1 Tax=Danaus chrysippus TaxID=151541 RepID=A0A8J2QIF7_9NEOP|nr:unnamed protein product [Danaus chrysippus]
MTKNKERYNHGTTKDSRETSEPLVALAEDRRERPPHYLPRLSVVLPSSCNSSVDQIPSPALKETLSHGDESMTVVLSAFYAKLLIVLGLALPVTSTIQNELYTNIISDIFTLYLYIVGMIFLAYTFFHLRIAKNIKDDRKRTRYGSFYLHMGVAGFGVGSIIYSCLQFGEYFDLSGDCQLLIVALKPTFRILFMIAQTIFIFSYTDVLDPMRGVVLDRFGLMHLIATNVCEWLNVVIQETRDDIRAVAFHEPALMRYTNIEGPSRTTLTETNLTSPPNHLNETEVITAGQGLEAWSCNVSNVISPLIRNMNPYLRPCGVEYSLLCSIIIVVIWNDVCTVPGSKPIASNSKLEKKPCSVRVKPMNHFSVDCGQAHKGLFLGVAGLAATIVSLMIFKGLFQKEKHVELALLTINVWETVLFVLMSVGSAACLQRMRSLSSPRRAPGLPLEHALLLVTQCGVYLYYLFQIIGAGFSIHKFPSARRATRIISPLCAVIQSSCQTLLVLDAWSRRSSGREERPGRQLVTFLLVSNFSLWMLNRVKNARAEFHPLQMEFYGVWAWTIITHVSVPLLVCYRFQATVCFYEIWKNSYKRKKEYDSELDEVELNKLDSP